jgi:Cd2+/Zn2+-exporting ATPase
MRDAESEKPAQQERGPFPLFSTLDARQLEVAFTAATFVLLLVSVGLEQSDLPASWVLPVNVLAYFFGGFWATRETLPELLRGKLDVDFLMIFAAVGAALIGHWQEGIILLFLFSLSNTLQTYAMERSRRAIDDLMHERPQEATVMRNGEEVVVPVEEVRVREMVILRPGEMVPTDGVVRRGQSEMNEASITGESSPAAKAPGDIVYAGAMNGTGTLDIEVTRLAEDSTIARIVQMIEAGKAHKAAAQSFLERAESIYAWGIVLFVLSFIFLPVLWGHPFHDTFYKGMTLLVVASPCALVISTPAAILSAIARGARLGVLFKGGAYLERMNDVRVVLFDKTGTLTTGKPGVTDVILAAEAPEGFNEDRLLGYAAALESRSEHVLSKEIVLAAERRKVARPATSDFVALPGRGVHAEIEDFQVWIGSNRLYEEHGEPIPEDLLEAKARLEQEGKTVLILHREIDRAHGVGIHEASGGWLGIIALSDTLREDAPETIRRLKDMGVEKVFMITGDNAVVARAVADQAGIDDVHADLLPEDKVRIVKQMSQEYGAVMMVGDGVNDAPALAHAAIGMAMGAAGTDLALESAHCVLMGDELRRVAFAMGLSRKAVRVVKQNLAFSLAVIVMLIGGVLLYTLPLPLGVVGHEGSTVLVCLNGLRLLLYRE